MCLEKSKFLFLVEWKPKGFIRKENIKVTRRLYRSRAGKKEEGDIKDKGN